MLYLYEGRTRLTENSETRIFTLKSVCSIGKNLNSSPDGKISGYNVKLNNGENLYVTEEIKNSILFEMRQQG